MSSERYVGERQALWHFLSELKPLVAEMLGRDSLLNHRIDRALKTGDLPTLRLARQIFHNHPDAVKRRLMRGIFDGTAAGAELPAVLPPDRNPLDAGLEETRRPTEAAVSALASRREQATNPARVDAALDDQRNAVGVGRTVVRFDAVLAPPGRDGALSVELSSEGCDGAPVQVFVQPGTLPRSAAEALRQIADWIEHDRRMLSSRNWALREDRSSPVAETAEETVDQA